MKIAIFHNLQKGGGLNSILSTVNQLSKKNSLDLFCFNEFLPKKNINNYNIFNLKKTKNVLEHLFQIFFELKKQNKIIADEINKNDYDLVLIYPCQIIQSPYLLRYIKNTYFYMFNEPKREFYEKTSYDYFSFKKTLSRVLRTPIKFIDKNNCKYSKYIITNSYFTSDQLWKIYKKSSFVVYPGYKKIKPKDIILKNNKKILSVGLFSKIKGHDFSIKQISKTKNELIILGRKTNEYENIKTLALERKVSIKIIHSENEQKKDRLYNQSSIFLANQEKEPFGLTTLEAADHSNFVLGKNEGGTPEIIENGVNGLLYPNDIHISSLIFRKIISKKYLKFKKTCTINWEKSSNQILQIYHYIKHEPWE